MRTTLDIDDAVLAAARSLARAEGISVGAAVSRLARRGLGAVAGTDQGEQTRIDVSYSPFPVLLGDPGHDVTPELVNAHRDDAD
ncbi:MAG: DUF2191 domain-containing protein [Nocardioidaceae bacterium]